MTLPSTIDEQAQGWFVRLNDADASEADWLAFQAWLEADPAHGRAYDAVEQLWVLLDEAPPAALPANDEIGDARRRPGRPVWLASAVGIAAAVALTVGVWPQVFGGTETYRTDDAPRTVTLSDGSTVYLNRHSDVRVRLRSGKREVTMNEGEAAFDVAHDATRPFVITADDHSVRVLGTAFNVINHDGRFSVSVERGVVAVTPARAQVPVRLTAGQRLDQQGVEAAVVASVDPSLASAWREGVLVYRDAPLAQVGDDLSRYLDKPVNVAASARNLHFTGVLQVRDEATLLDQLQELAPVEISRTPGEVQLTRHGSR